MQRPCTPHRGLLLLGYAALLGTVIGCGGAKTATVSGTVKYGAEPLPGGMIWFVWQGPKGTDQQSAVIEADGKYTIGVPLNISAKVKIDNQNTMGINYQKKDPTRKFSTMTAAEKKKILASGTMTQADLDRAIAEEGKGGGPKSAGHWVPINKKFSDEKTSGLTVEVNDATVEKDFTVTK